ncbi:MAG: hypothetical protein V1859_03195 [archaeon]
MKKIIIFLLVLTALASNAVAVINIDISVKNQFQTGDKIAFNYRITSDTDLVIKYITDVVCPDMPSPLLELKEATLIKGIPLNEEYVFFNSMPGDVERQMCTVRIYVLEPIEITKEALIELIPLKNMILDLFICEDKSCLSQKKVFISGSTVYFQYSTHTDSPLVSAQLTFPDGSKKNIILPGQITVEETGTYRLTVSASKKGYMDFKLTSEFAVIPKKAEIEAEKTCNNNGKCESPENSQNCPLDCKTGANDSFCDYSNDGKCDPDCHGEDMDCKIEKSNSIVNTKPNEPNEKKEDNTKTKSVFHDMLIEIFLALVIFSMFIFIMLKKSRKKRK